MALGGFLRQTRKTYNIRSAQDALNLQRLPCANVMRRTQASEVRETSALPERVVQEIPPRLAMTY
jgi:hypothetical protein